jgi:hypothetical protein
MTPLHFAVRSCEEIDSSRSIRALLLKGANTQIRDFENQLPIDYIEEFSDHSAN